MTTVHTPADPHASWTPQRIPIALPPIPGEAVDSWIEAYARRLGTCSKGWLGALGLTGSPRHMVMTLTTAERDTLTAATGVSPADLDAMTLHRFDTIAVTINRTRRIAEHPPAWRRHSGSRYCPACLREDAGRWQLHWRLPWTFACLRHHQLLTETCPACGHPTHPDRPGDRGAPSAPGACTAPAPGNTRSRHPPACGHPLTSVTTTAFPADGITSHAARHIHDLITAAATDQRDRTSTRDELTDVFTLAHRAIRALNNSTGGLPEAASRATIECGGVIPEPFAPLRSVSAHTIAVGTSIAVAADIPGPASDEVLSWIVRRHHQWSRPEPGALLRQWRNTRPALHRRIMKVFDDALTTHARLTMGTCTSTPRPPTRSTDQARRRAAALPALLWPCWSMRLIPPGDRQRPLGDTRAALAVLALIPGTGVTYRQAAGWLGNRIGNSAVQPFIRSLTEEHRVSIIRLLTQLAHRLDDEFAPIDYDRRRALFTQAQVDRGACATLAATHGWRPPSQLQLHILDSHLATTLTGAPGPANATPQLGTAGGANLLVAALPGPARDFIHHQAEQLLGAHHIREPQTWRPAPPLTPDAPWPGTGPNTVAATTFTDAIGECLHAHRPLARLSGATGLSNVHARLYTEVAALNMDERSWDGLADSPDHPLLDPARLQHLYHDQELTLEQIAHRCLTSEASTRQALAAAGIDVLARRPRRARITRDWLERHYLNTGKSAKAAARDAGCTRNTLAAHAKALGIPFGSQAPIIDPFRGWPARHQPPPNVAAACAGRNGVQYTREVLHMAQHRTRRAAAAALGLHETVLMRHRQHVERAAATRIFKPGTPLTPTPDGEQFLHHATAAIRRLDQLRRTEQ